MSWSVIWPLAVAMGIVLAVVPILGLYMTFIERKIAAYIQDRIGPKGTTAMANIAQINPMDGAKK